MATAPTYRCDGCGYLVNVKPCPLCRLRKALARGPIAPAAEVDDDAPPRRTSPSADVMEVLGDEWLDAHEVSDLSGLDHHTAGNVLDRLAKQGDVEMKRGDEPRRCSKSPRRLYRRARS